MNSPILESIYQYTGIDPAYLLFALAFFVVVFMILVIVTLCKLKKVYRAYDKFMRGKDAESLEETILSCIAKADEVKEVNAEIWDNVIALQKKQRITYQKMGIVKYNAFREMSGDLSYVLALLDQKNNGFVMNSVYAKEGGYSYIKEIKNGESAILLSEEEQKALEKAKSQT